MIKVVFISTFIFCVRTIRLVLGPGNCCRYFVSCTDYAQEQFKNQNFFKAIINIIKRVLWCNQFSSKPYFDINERLNDNE